MRIAEVMGFRGEYVFYNYIVVCGQYGDSGYQDFTKEQAAILASEADGQTDFSLEGLMERETMLNVGQVAA